MQTYKIIANVQQYSLIKIKYLSATCTYFVGICKDFSYPESKLKHLIPQILIVYLFKSKDKAIRFKHG